MDYWMRPSIGHVVNNENKHAVARLCVVGGLRAICPRFAIEVPSASAPSLPGMRTKADVGFPPNLWVHARVLGRPGERRDHYAGASRFWKGG